MAEEKSGQAEVDRVIERVAARDPNQPEFLQAVTEVLSSLAPAIAQDPSLAKNNLLERICEPERMIAFRVPWVDDKGVTHVQRGYRVQFNSAIGPYKGGLRFHPTVNLSVVKFLGFEQIFKNALTGLPMGGGKGGSDFDPKGKSDMEIMRFCQAFMSELSAHIGPNVDVPAGDIGVGGREIGYLYGYYKKLQRASDNGVLTGKDPSFGGSLIRPEATGYGLVFFAREMLKANGGKTLKGLTCSVSGSGNVATFATEKLIELGAKVVTLSDSGGCIHDADGITKEKLAWVMELKNVRRGRIKEYADQFGAKFYPAAKGGEPNPIWAIKVDCAFPCATQNEINETDAKTLVANGVQVVAEGANMPTTEKGMHHFVSAAKDGLLYGPSKACNAGGVATSGLEMTQNSMRLSWTREEVEAKLDGIMTNIHKNAFDTAKKFNRPGDYVFGANVAGFVKIARAMHMQGIV